jgi:hypothetical protein
MLAGNPQLITIIGSLYKKGENEGKSDGLKTLIE